jgi:hypothetical protein
MSVMLMFVFDVADQGRYMNTVKKTARRQSCILPPPCAFLTKVHTYAQIKCNQALGVFP